MTQASLSPDASPSPAQDMADACLPAESELEDHRNRPHSQAFVDFITAHWAPRAKLEVTRMPAANYTQARREALSALFPGARLVIPAGPLKVRSNDTDYRFRPHTAFAHLTGLGTDQEPDAVLVLHPLVDAPSSAGPAGNGGRVMADAPGFADVQVVHGDASAASAPVLKPRGHEAVLYVRPLADRDTEEFYANARYGEFWVGARPSLDDVTTMTGITARHIDSLPDALAKDVGAGVSLLVVPDADAAVESLVDTVRRQAGVDATQALTDASDVAVSSADAAAQATGSPTVHRLAEDQLTDANLGRAVGELRLIKDAYEVEQMRLAVDATIDGFAQVVRQLPRAVAHSRGERVVETTFDAHARLEGNAVGYETIAAAGDHATTLHWITNNGPVHEGQLLLLDAGVEVESLYTADITRTLPVNGRFTPVQRRVYQAVLDAADAAFAAAVPGAKFLDVHEAAMQVIAQRLELWGLLPEGVTADVALTPAGQQHRRWMVHGTSHHLGLDVHDCAGARRELYQEGILTPGMVFTIEPGLYFKADDLAVPQEYRGIGVRIEDDVLITAEGNENLSAALPRTPDAIEAWMASLM